MQPESADSGRFTIKSHSFTPEKPEYVNKITKNLKKFYIRTKKIIWKSVQTIDIIKVSIRKNDESAKLYNVCMQKRERPADTQV